MFKKESSKEKAIDAFKRHHLKLNKTDTYQWLRYSADLTDKYIGPETQLRVAWQNLIHYDTNNLSQKASSLLEQCIESIKDNGIYKPANNNFLMTLSNGELSTLISTVLIASVGGAWFLGTNYNQFRIDKLNEETLRLESSLKKAETTLLSTKNDLSKCISSHKSSIKSPTSNTAIVISIPRAAGVKNEVH